MSGITKSESMKNTKSRKSGAGRNTRRPGRAKRSPEQTLEAQLKKIKTALATAKQREVLDQYPIACMCRDIRDNVDDQFGKAPITTACDALGWSRVWFGKVASVADCWPTQRNIAAVSRRVDCRGIPLSWTHLVELAGLEAPLFEELLEETLEKGLSTRELTRRIGEEQATNKDEDDDCDIRKCLDDEDVCDEGDEDQEDQEDDEDQDLDEEDRDDDEDSLAGLASDDDSEVDIAAAEADDDPIEVALAYFESGGELDVTCEFLRTSDLDATIPEGLTPTPNQRYRLEAIAVETEQIVGLLRQRLLSLYRVLNPEKRSQKRRSKAAKAKAAA